MGFVHLHCHSREGSLLDGLVSVKDYASKAKEFGQDAIAITEHGFMGSMVKFYKACRKEEIKPIIGYEAYMVDDVVKTKEQQQRDMNHLILLAKNKTGLQNILLLNDFAFRHGFYYKPRIDKDVLKKHKEGLVVSSACLASEIAQHLLTDNRDKAVETIKWFKEIFKDDFYLEVQDHELIDQALYNSFLECIAKEEGIKIIATNDIHYLTKEDADPHRILLCAQIQKTYVEAEKLVKEGKGFSGYFESSEWYFKSEEEMSKLFPKEYLENTLEIANKCEVVLDRLEENPTPKYFFPNFKVPNKLTINDYFKQLCWKGFEERSREDGWEDIESYKSRLTYEVDIISKMGFQGYFLVLWDVIDFCRKQDIPVGPGRGSAAGSLASYCLRITNIDPIKYDLLFERFLNPSRVSNPDIDLDFCYDRVGEVYDYVVKKYGEDYVCKIGTYGTLSVKAVLKDVARVLEYDFDKINLITKSIPMNITKINTALDEVKEFRDAVSADEKLEEIVEVAKRLEGGNRHTSEHAAGVVISPIPLRNFIPLKKDVSQLDMKDLEEYGLVKMDFLRLRTLTAIKNTLNLLKEKGININIDKIDFADEKVFDLFAKGETIGVFQFESNGIQQMLKGIKPTSIDDIIAGAALYRPGPLDFKDEETGMTMVDQYIARKNGEQEVVYDHPKLEPILKDTYGVLVFQESLMQTSVALAGYMLHESDSLRKIIGKKLKDKMPLEKEKFINGCINNEVDSQVAHKVWDKIETFGSYGFNKCLTGDTIINLTNNKNITINDLLISNRKEFGYSVTDNNNIVENEIIDVFYTGDKEVFEIEMESGHKVKCTKDHKFLTSNGYKTITEIIENNFEILYVVKKEKYNMQLSRTKIKSIKQLGIQPTYNIEMKHPNHNYVINNGLVSANSHSTAYALIAYQCAFLKTYYPVEFMTSILNSVIGEKPEKVARYLNECRRMKIKIIPPDINKSQINYIPYNGQILFGLNGIAKVGDVAVRKIFEIRKKINKEPSFFEFFNLIDKRAVNRGIMENLILCGCFDYLGYSRASLVKYVKELYETLHKVNTRIRGNAKRKNPIADISVFYKPLYEVKLEPIKEFPFSKILSFEKEITNLYLSGHPLDIYWDSVGNFVSHTAGTLDEAEIEQSIFVAGLITDKKTVFVKKGNSKGKPMAIMEIEDIDGKIRLTVFSKVYEKCKDILDIGSFVKIRGITSIYNDEINIIANEIKLVENNEEPEEEEEEEVDSMLYILISKNITNNDLNKLRIVLSNHKGKSKVCLLREDSERESILSVRVNSTKSLIKDILKFNSVLDAWTE